MTMELTTEAQATRAFLLTSGTMPTCDVAEEIGYDDETTHDILHDLESLGLVEQVPFVGWRWQGD